MGSISIYRYGEIEKVYGFPYVNYIKTCSVLDSYQFSFCWAKCSLRTPTCPKFQHTGPVQLDKIRVLLLLGPINDKHGQIVSHLSYVTQLLVLLVFLDLTTRNTFDILCFTFLLEF
jgi:hypothetical protein